MSSQEDRNKPKSGRVLMIALFAAVIVAFIVSGGFVLAKQQLIQRQTTELSQTAALGPHVLVAQISGGGLSRTIELPATIHGYIETPVYAKVAGYMKTINVDKGDHVSAGEVIALIESPETDKMVADARSFYWIQNVTDIRNQELVRQEVVPQQTADETHSAMLQAKAAYQQQLAMQQYEIVRAPFDGVVTARFIDPGTLIPAATAPVSATASAIVTTNSTTTPIVSLASQTPLRVYAFVPQSVSSFIKDGDPATVTVIDYPNRKFTSTITRHPEAIDQVTRTMQVEVDLANQDRALLPGMYANMKMTAHVTVSSLTAPDDALVFRNDKIYLPVVRENHLRLVEVTLGHDDGYTVEVNGDLRAGEQIAVNVGEAARDGEPVQPVESNASKS
ncbi:MAG: efflux RND transporter periplasmic adaptor subunit [Candidatus Binatus sp.]|uniref:efflux RND transporter periplasmic adaptor subunit n=1 Tax=Candidatus Binatus sp. TaxID=2811406 RepID=UPI003BB15FDB